MINGLLSFVLVLGANVYTDTFDAALKAYNSGDFNGAIQQYEQVVAEGVVSAPLFYNLANAYYRAGKLAPAIVNYERALELNPGLENARQNLDTAVRATPHHLARPLPPDWEQSLFFWHYNLSTRATYWLAGIAWLAFWSLLGVRQWRPLRYTRLALIAAGVLAVSFGASAWAKNNAAPLAVAAMEKVPVRYGTDDNETVRFELGAGDRVTVDRRERGWLRVTTADGERGWAKEGEMILAGPPYAPAFAAPAKEAPK